MVDTPANQRPIRVHGAIDAVAIGLATIALVFGLWLALIGLPHMVGVPAGEVGAPAGAAEREWQTSATGWVFALGGAVALFGVLRDHRMAAWTGAGVIAAYAGLGIFGVGALLIPVGLLLVIALSVRAIARR